MLRHLFFSLLLGTFLLAPSGCGQPAIEPSSATALAGAATPAPASTSTLPQTEVLLGSPPPTESASASLQTPAAPTASEAPTDRPTSVLSATARPTSIAVSPQAAPQADRVMLRGVITSLDGNGLKLDVSSERISLTDTTTVLALTKPLPATSLAVGRNIVVQATRNAQGQLVAERISILPNVLRKPLPLSK